MIRFSAKYNALIDDKGRVVLPSPFKKLMGSLSAEPIVIEKDIYKPCLNIYPQKVHEERLVSIESKLNLFDEGDDDLLADLARHLAGAQPVHPGAAGRGRRTAVRVPAEDLRRWARGQAGVRHAGGSRAEARRWA